MKKIILTLIVFIISLNVLYSQVPQIIFKPSKGAILKKEDVDNTLKENGLTREDQFECIVDNSVTKISVSAFKDCYEMAKLTLSSNLVSIADSAFRNCQVIPELILPKNLETIGNRAFTFCKNIRKINIPQSLIEIGPVAFSDCSKLQTIIFPKNSKLEIIGDHVFNNCSIKEITIPKSVKRIGDFIFVDCNLLKKVTFLSSDPSGYSPIGLDNVCTIKIPKGTKKKYLDVMKDWQYYIDNGKYKIVE